MPRLRTVVYQPVVAPEPQLSPPSPWPIVVGRRVQRRYLDAICHAGTAWLPELGGRPWAPSVYPGSSDGPVALVWHRNQPTLWTLAPGAQRPLAVGPTPPPDCPWADPLTVAQLAIAHCLPRALPVSYALVALDHWLRAGETSAPQALVALPWTPSPGVPDALVAYVRAYVCGAEPPWPWDLWWGHGVAVGELAQAALAYAIECHDDRTAHYHLGTSLALAGHWAAAEAHWAVATDSPHAPLAWRNLALAAVHAGDDRAARAAYRAALAAGAGALTRAEATRLGV